jgi:hypothetical protein
VSSAKQRPIRVGLQLRPQHADYTTIRRKAAEAEELGVDILFNWDHFFPLGKARGGKHFECWTMLGAWAESTSRARLARRTKPLNETAGKKAPQDTAMPHPTAETADVGPSVSLCGPPRSGRAPRTRPARGRLAGR